MDLLNDYHSEDDIEEGIDRRNHLDLAENDEDPKEPSLLSFSSSPPAPAPTLSPEGTVVEQQPGHPNLDEEEMNTTTEKFITTPSLRLQAAPVVSLLAGRPGRAGSSTGTSSRSTALTARTDTARKTVRGAGARGGGELMLLNNPTKLVMYQPVHGPQAPDPDRPKTSSFTQQQQQVVAFEEATFAEQRVEFQRAGRALAPDAAGTVVYRTTLGYDPHRLEYLAQKEAESRKRPRPAARGEKRNNDANPPDPLVLGSDDEAEYGVWAPPSREEQWAAEQTVSNVARGGVESLAPAQRAEREYLQERDRQRGVEQERQEQMSAFDRLVERKMAHLLPPTLPQAEALAATSTFHGEAETDYQGRSWIAPPSGLGAMTMADEGVDLDHHKCYVPKKCVHRFQGPTKGIQRIRLFPRTGHLVLSAGLDGQCQIWSLPLKRLMRTYIGHAAAVRDVQFNHSGSKFVSASFDRFLRLWDTESGQVLQTLTNKKVPYVVQFYPHDDNFLVVGGSDHKIVTYNTTTAEITQEYNHHLAPVNAIVFVEDHGTKMVTTSDDKKVLVWEWDIGVPIKYISDPTMHSIPVLVMHPSQQFFCGQSLDNTIVVFQAGGRFALQKRKKFSGHVVAGYACEMAFSPDGHFLVSGDGSGHLFFWDWKRHGILQKYRAHQNGPAMACCWHPLQPSTVLTCGWDGVIKVWE